MKQRFVVTYDISDQARLRKVYKVMRGFGRHLQYSVFLCDLSALNLARLKAGLLEVIASEQDQVLIVDLGPTDGWRAEVIESLGRPYVPPSTSALVL
jgi:CRISPR-associated protein Cas2